MDSVFVFDEKFVEAFCSRLPGTRQHRVLGRKLRPYSLWHELQMQMVDSRFLVGGEVGLLDLDIATRVCQTRFRERVILPKSSTWNKLTWALRLRGNLRREVKKFENYLMDFYSPPKYWPKNETGQNKESERQIDELFEIVVLIAKHTGWTQEYIWEMPSGEAHWWAAGLMVIEGADTLIWTPADEAANQRHLATKAAKTKKRFDELVKDGLEPRAAAIQAKKEELRETALNTMAIGFCKAGALPETAMMMAKAKMAAADAADAMRAAEAAPAPSDAPATPPDSGATPPNTESGIDATP